MVYFCYMITKSNGNFHVTTMEEIDDNKALEKKYKEDVMAIHDAMDVLSGKWKISILASLCYFKRRRFSEILNNIPTISNKMLSKELKDLEINKLIIREVVSTQPIIVEYQLTEYGKKLNPVVEVMANWGKMHRQEIIG